MQKVAVNSFVRRQTADSKFSHFGGSEHELVGLVLKNFERAMPGYRDGVILVPVPPEKFFSGVVEVTESTPLQATFGARRKGEAPYIDVVAVGGDKLPAQAVDVVLYRHDVLGDEATECPGCHRLGMWPPLNEMAGCPQTCEVCGGTGHRAKWEIVSLNARPTAEVEPMTPMAMARNFLAMAGGTKADYTAEEFAKAIVYWSARAMRG